MTIKIKDEKLIYFNFIFVYFLESMYENFRYLQKTGERTCRVIIHYDDRSICNSFFNIKTH